MGVAIVPKRIRRDLLHIFWRCQMQIRVHIFQCGFRSICSHFTLILKNSRRVFAIFRFFLLLNYLLALIGGPASFRFFFIYNEYINEYRFSVTPRINKKTAYNSSWINAKKLVFSWGRTLTSKIFLCNATSWAPESGSKFFLKMHDLISHKYELIYDPVVKEVVLYSTPASD